MRQKIPLFDRRRRASTAPSTPSSPRMPWRSRRREEPKQPSASQSEFNSIRVNTADYRSLGLLRQYDDDRINASSISQPTSERDHRPHSSNTNELERNPSENPTPRYQRNPRRPPGECLFLTSGYRVNAKGSSSVKELFSSEKDLSNEYEDGTLPFPEQSGEGFLLRGKWCLMTLFLVLAFGAAVGLSWYLSCHGSMKKSSVHAFAAANPVARLLGFLGGSGTSADARSMWINHVVKNDDNQILVAETFESRLNAEITPLLEKYTGNIWDSASSSPFMCHGDDRLMLAFSVVKAGSLPASITYETPCVIGPSSRSCVVKKRIPDVRDLVVRLPSKSSRYMHAVHVEIDHTSKDHPSNSSEARHTQDLGTISGQFRVELSDAARLALQRYCGHNKKAFSEDLMTEPVSERNTRLINVYELKRLYALLSNQSDAHVRRSGAWDTRMLSTVIIDPLEHSRHSLAPIHIEQLLSHLRGIDHMKPPHTSYNSPVSHISVSRSRERNEPLLSGTTSPQPSETRKDVESNGSILTTNKEPKMSSPSFNFQPPPTPSSTAGEKSVNYSSDDSNDGSNVDSEHWADSELPSSPANEQEPDDMENNTTEDTMKIDEEDTERDTAQETTGAQNVTSQSSATTGTGPVPINEESGKGSQTMANTDMVSKRHDSVQPSGFSSGSVNSMNTAESSTVLREASSSQGSALAQTPSLPSKKTAPKKILVPSAMSHQVFPPWEDKYRENSPSAQKFSIPAELESNTLTAKSFESRPGLVRPLSGGTHQRGAGQALFAGTLTQRANPAGQVSKMRSSLGLPRTQSLPSSSAGELPPYKQGLRFPPQIPSSSTAQNLLASPAKQDTMNARTSSLSSVSPGVVKTLPQTHESAISGEVPMSSSTGGMLDSSSGPVRAWKNENSQQGTTIAQGALVQPVVPRNVASTQVTFPNADHHVQDLLKKRTESGAVLRQQPASVISILNQQSQERPAD